MLVYFKKDWNLCLNCMKYYDCWWWSSWPIRSFCSFAWPFKSLIPCLSWVVSRPFSIQKKDSGCAGFTNLSEVDTASDWAAGNFPDEICLNETVLDIVKSDISFTITTSQANIRQNHYHRHGRRRFQTESWARRRWKLQQPSLSRLSNISQYAGGRCSAVATRLLTGR